MKRSLSRRIIMVMVVGILVTSSFAAGNVTGYMARTAFARDNEPPEFGIFWEAWDLVINNFVDQNKIDFKAMTYGAIQGMLDSLGDQNHTVFFPPDVAKEQQTSLEGSFEGIGAYVSSKNGRFTIVAPIHGSPAEKAGILAGDVVLDVNGVSINGKPEWEVISMIRGPAGTSITLTVRHPNASDPVDVVVVRGHIDVQSVLWTRIPGTDVAYLQITQFASDTGKELNTALQAILAESDTGRPISGIMLDLRNNPGGYLQEALHVASQFLPEGDIILHEKDAKQQITTYRSQGTGLARSIPLVVLINEGSASASEIVAGALQEDGRAKLVGQTTIGTGTVLRPFTLSDGSVLRLGVTNWLTPDYNMIKGQGIQPDVKIEQSASITMTNSYALEKMDAQAVHSDPDRQFQTALLMLHFANEPGIQATKPESVP